MPWGVAAAGGASAIATGVGSMEAAGAQEASSAAAIAEQEREFDVTQQNLEPYNTAGQNASSMLTADLPALTAPVTMNEAALEQTPGYQFNLSQGLESTQNSAAARGLGTSGAALKGAAAYATGLADSTYQNQFNNAVTNSNNTYNRLLGVSSLGENAAASVGNAATATGQGIASSTQSAGNAAAAADNATASGVSGAANSYGLYSFLSNQNNLPTSPTTGSAYPTTA